MSCAFPVTIHLKDGRNVKVPCGRCMCCRVRKQSQLTFLAHKELLDVYSSGRGASFVTLTYSEDHIPHGDKNPFAYSLRRKDLQDFLKRMRISLQRDGFDISFKTIYCGELGDKFGRPHYHIAFLGLTDVLAAKYVSKCWTTRKGTKLGRVDVGVLRPGGLRYIVKYMTKSRLSPEQKRVFEAFGCETPFIGHSIGLGKKWLMSHVDDILESNGYMRVKTALVPYPRYVLDYVKVITGHDLKQSILYDTMMSVAPAAAAAGRLYDDYLAEQAYIKERMLTAAAIADGRAADLVEVNLLPYRTSVKECVKKYVKECLAV